MQDDFQNDPLARELRQLPDHQAPVDLLPGIMKSVSPRKQAVRPHFIRRVRSWSFPYFRSWAVPLAAAATLVVGLGLWYLSVLNSGGVVVAQVMDAKVRMADGTWSAAKIGDKIAAGTKIETGEKGRVVLAWVDDKTRVELLQKTKLEVRKRYVSDEKPTELQLERGRVLCAVAKQKIGKPFVVRTPSAEIRVIGTQFEVLADEKSTRLKVTEGKVQMTRLADQKSVMVDAGFMAEAIEGIGFATRPLPPRSVLMHYDFDDGKHSPNGTGRIAVGPEGQASLQGEFNHNDNLYRIRFADRKRGLFTYHKGMVLHFDYWVDKRTGAIDIYLWDGTQQKSIGTYIIWEPTQKGWVHATIDLSKLSEGEPLLQEGNRVTDLTIQTSTGGGQIYVDNVEAVVAGPIKGV